MSSGTAQGDHPGSLISVGWREWLSLPELGLPPIKAKIDTGAKTSCLHAFSLETFKHAGKPWIRFGMHPDQHDRSNEVFCEAEIIDEREVTDSGGHKENRYVIATQLVLPNISWPIELTLTNRDSMRFRMLLGRSAMNGRMIVVPDQSYMLGKPALMRVV